MIDDADGDAGDDAAQSEPLQHAFFPVDEKIGVKRENNSHA
jgi:hypothetical protein